MPLTITMVFALLCFSLKNLLEAWQIYSRMQREKIMEKELKKEIGKIINALGAPAAPITH